MIKRQIIVHLGYLSCPGGSLSGHAVASPLASPITPHPISPISPSSPALWLERLISDGISWALLLASFIQAKGNDKQVRRPEGREVVVLCPVVLCSRSQPLKISTFLYDYSSHWVSSLPWF